MIDSPALLQDARPPEALMRIVNPLVRLLLRTPASRCIRPLALVEFRGRHTGLRRRVVVGWHIVEGTPVVVTPAGWRVNFTGGHEARVRWRGHRGVFMGTLDADPDSVAHVVNTLVRGGTSARSLALRIPAAHVVTAADVTATRRAAIRFRSVA